MKNPIEPACTCSGMDAIIVVYGRGRFPKEQRRGADGIKPCRGCGAPVPKGRLTWCCQKCKHRFDPGYVLMAVRQRDKDICAMCGLDCKKAYKEWHRDMVANRSSYGWQKDHPRPPKAEYDHITPFSEGGLTVLENMRTVCAPCHRKITKEWHGTRSAKKQAAQAEDLFATLPQTAP